MNIVHEYIIFDVYIILDMNSQINMPIEIDLKKIFYQFSASCKIT